MTDHAPDVVGLVDGCALGATGLHQTCPALLALQAEVARLTTERDGWKKDAQTAQANWHAACNDLDRLAGEVARLQIGMGNCRLYAARHRKEEWAKEILRFCTDAGEGPNPLREQGGPR